MVSKSNLSLIEKVLRKIKRIDLFGIPISLTHKNTYTFKTQKGGALSLVLILIVLIYFLLGLQAIIHNEAEISLTYTYFNEAFDNTVYEIPHE